MQHAICGKCIGLEARALARTSYACISPVCSLVICKVTVLIRVMTTSQGCYKMQMKSRMCKNSVNCKVLSSRRHHNYFSGALSLSPGVHFHMFSRMSAQIFVHKSVSPNVPPKCNLKPLAGSGFCLKYLLEAENRSG